MQVAGSEQSDNGLLPDEVTRSFGTRWKRVIQSSTLVLIGLAFVSVAKSVLESPKGLWKADVDAPIELFGWNAYVHHMITTCGGDCDKGAILGLGGGGPWTVPHGDPLILDIPHHWDGAKIAHGVKSNDVFKTEGIRVEGQKYFMVRALDNMVIGWKKSVGGVTLMTTKQSISVLRFKTDKFPARTLIAQHQVTNHLENTGHRRLQDDDDKMPVVIEMGPGFTRVGMAGDEKPKHVDTEKTFYDEKNGFEDVDKAMEHLKKVLEASKVSIKDSIVILSDNVFITPKSRERLVQQMFEDFGVSGLKVSDATEAALASTGEMTGVAVHLLDGSATIEPCYDGFALPAASKFVALEADGSNLAEEIYNSIMKCDVDLRKDLYNNIVLYGEHPGLADLKVSVKKQVEELAPPTMTIKTSAQGKGENWGFIGMSIVSSLSTFAERTMTKEDYDAHGPGLMKYFDL